MFFASIPSPASNAIEIGPLDLRYYGLMIGLGVVAAIIVTTRRYGRMGGDTAIAEKLLVWAVVAGVLGARLAYVAPRFSQIAERGFWHLFAIWEGGLALYGGLTAGVIVGVWLIRRSNGDVPIMLDAAAIGIPLAQGIGRWGNYFNQELFGTPSDLPWAVEIAERFRPSEYIDSATFHPVFLYESLWNLAIVIPLVLWVEKRFNLRRGNLFLVYLITYGLARFALEFIRTDNATIVAGMRANQLFAALVVLVAAVFLFIRQRQSAGTSQEGVGGSMV
jgi:prolipoprotein diacylglyceryl transferase